MSVTTAELAYCMTLPPKRAVSYLKSKGYQITWDWEEMWQEAHARAFTVAKVTRLDILEDIRGALQQAVDEGKTDRWFRQELEPVLKRKGWWGPRDTTDPVTGKPVTISRAVRGGSIPSFAPICPYSTAPVVGGTDGKRRRQAVLDVYRHQRQPYPQEPSGAAWSGAALG